MSDTNARGDLLAEPLANGNHRQLWQCLCGKLRSWGIGYPEDPERVVFLECSDCRRMTAHGYARIKTKKNGKKQED